MLKLVENQKYNHIVLLLFIKEMEKCFFQAKYTNGITLNY